MDRTVTIEPELCDQPDPIPGRGDVLPRRASSRRNPKIGYVPGLDGLRALSVVAVLAFHFRSDHSLLKGGFLGVEVFFVISGYLITSLLIAERRRYSKISLLGFWMRRIRRLFAAMYATLIVVGLTVAVFFHEELGKLRGPLYSAAFYIANWQQVFSHVQYGASTDRAPLGHLWSLAVEEQFYFAWPLLFAFGMFVLGRRFRWVIGVGVLASWWWMAHLIGARPSFHRAANDLTFSQQQKIGDAFNRIYLATDTRAAGLLLGAFLAYFWVPRLLHATGGKHLAAVLDTAAAGAALLLIVLTTTASLNSVWLYSWGFVVVDLCTIVLIAAIVHPASHVGRVLGMRPLRAIGVRSYGIYLWGVAIFEFTRPGAGFDLELPGVVVLLIRLVVTVVVVEISYRCIEQPIRGGALGRLWQSLQAAQGKARERLVLRWQVVGITFAVVCIALTTATGFANVPKQAAAAGGGDCIALGTCKIPTIPSIPTQTATTTAGQGKPGKHVVVPPKIDNGGYAVTTVGDSVMLGAHDTLIADLSALTHGGVLVNAEVARQGQVCLDTLNGIKAQHALGTLVIVHCGNNGTLPDNFVDRVMEIAGNRRHVMFITAKVPRGWETPNNQQILDRVAKFKNARMLDWHWFAAPKPPEFFARDGYHLSGPSVTLYVSLIHDFVVSQHWT